MIYPNGTIGENAFSNVTTPSPIGWSPLGVQDSSNCGGGVVVSTSIIMIVTSLIVLLRIISRFCLLKQAGPDDWLIAAATVGAIANVVCIGIGVKYGTGRHESSIPISDNKVAVKYRLVTHILYTVVTVLVKSSLLMLYLRVFPHLRRPIIGITSLIIAMGIAFVLAASFRCNPVEAVWDPWKYPVDSFTCFPALPFWVSSGIFFILSDVVVLLLPMKSVLALHISRRKKVVVIFLLSLGGFACVAGVARMVYVVKLYTDRDAAWNTASVSIASTFEICLAIIAASLPGTRVVVDRLFPSLFRTHHSSRSPNRAYWEQRNVGGSEIGSEMQHRDQQTAMRGKADKSRWRHGKGTDSDIFLTEDFELDVSSGNRSGSHWEETGAHTRYAASDFSQDRHV